jgi:O-antigen/teichoic acid export membrane protein
VAAFQRIRTLGRDLAVYGAGDVATQALSLLLLPLYVRYLSPGDYGALALLLTVEMLTKIVFRWGLDASFMRMYYDCHDQASKQRLASTIVLFLAGANGLVLAVALILAPQISRFLFGSPSHALALQVVLLNMFLGGFFFVPFHELRIQRQSERFIALTITRSALTIGLRLALVIGLRLGVIGVVLADLVTTVLFTAILSPRFAPLLRMTFSRALLLEALRFGVPRIPHGLAQQTVAVSDRYVLSRYATLHEIGLYSIGASFAMGLKLALNAFESAWAPLYFSLMREPDAKATYRVVATWGTALLIGLALMVAAAAPQIVAALLPRPFHAASVVIPWIALAVVLQGVYLLTSIGLNITKRTEFYPVATGAAAASSLALNLLLVPRYGVTGAAAATACSYGVLAGLSAAFANRVYPVGYEWGRMARLGAAGLAAYAVAVVAVSETWPVLAGLVARAVLAALAYTGLLASTGFLTAAERRRMRAIWMAALDARNARRQARPVETEASETTEMAGQMVSGTAGEVIESDDPGLAPAADRKAEPR